MVKVLSLHHEFRQSRDAIGYASGLVRGQLLKVLTETGLMKIVASVDMGQPYPIGVQYFKTMLRPLNPPGRWKTPF
ncbi:hypothetical protein GGQ85_002195 [Nitrobacter vulgaris]|uniref:hypothetical protein n=1 Tax=Nitrobacter vulgaris TaxID=29421 RepID=UPI002866CAE2|nr:hypothetical protein [Nitrobacter vulgaris]MDR6304488.1 hypothetical protein [Nitrobacter vulgaris]